VAIILVCFSFELIASIANGCLFVRSGADSSSASSPTDFDTDCALFFESFSRDDKALPTLISGVLNSVDFSSTLCTPTLLSTDLALFLLFFVSTGAMVSCASHGSPFSISLHSCTLWSSPCLVSMFRTNPVCLLWTFLDVTFFPSWGAVLNSETFSVLVSTPRLFSTDFALSVDLFGSLLTIAESLSIMSSFMSAATSGTSI